MNLLRHLILPVMFAFSAAFLGAQTLEEIPVATPVDDFLSEEVPSATPVNEDEQNIPLAQPVLDQPGPATAPSLSLPVDQAQTQIAILGYHDFSTTKPATDMRIRTAEFKEQMMMLKRSGVSIISLQDLIDWKLGAKKLPAHCVLVTIDDGWKSVYTDAYPILKELGIPFTIFVYTSFISGQGASLGTAQIEEMMQNGCTVGSHSSKHLYPSAWTKAQKSGETAYLKMIDEELRDSALLLRESFRSPIEAYCYPGGFFTNEMIAAAPKAGYKLAFTVQPQKVIHNTDNFTMHRYIIYGKNPQTFTNATRFGAISNIGKAPERIRSEAVSPDDHNFSPIPPFPVSPAPNSTQVPFTGELSISLASIPTITPGSLSLQVSGFGKVPHQWIPETKTLKWSSSRKLYGPIITVQATWKTPESTAKQSAIWKFRIKDIPPAPNRAATGSPAL